VRNKKSAVSSQRNERNARNEFTNLRTYEFTQASANGNRAVLFPAELSF